MPDAASPALPTRAAPGGLAVVWLIGLACALSELVLIGADWGLWGSARWRPLAYAQGAFWAGLLHGWWPNYALQPGVMFFSYAWLHADAGHLAGNLAALAWLGPQVAARRGPIGFVALWLAATVGGGAAFGWIVPGPAPMVGASGALFGLAADWLVAEVRSLSGIWARAQRIMALVALLLALNAAAWAMQGGQLAWQAHLGGFLAGLAVALIWRR